MDTFGLLASFWMGGFEGSDHINGRGEALDMQRASGHLAQMEADYRRAAAAGLLSLRESAGWRLCEPASGSFDFSRVERMAWSARRSGVQLLWSLMHYGLPADLSLHDDALIERFARFAGEFASVLKPLSLGPPIYTPVNEIGYLAWMASQPHLLAPPNNTAGDSPESSLISGYTVKRRLVRAALAAIEAIRAVDGRARFLHVEPVCHVVAPQDRPELSERAAEVRGWQWQAWDLLSGRIEPGLGGSPDALDLLGINHYHSSQWEVGTEKRLAWHLCDPRRLPLATLLQETWQRYGRPLLIAETGHVGSGRAEWLNDMAAQARHARTELGVPLLGLCLYPLVDRPDWNEPLRWHESGLWQVDPLSLCRSAVPPYLRALQTWQSEWPAAPARA